MTLLLGPGFGRLLPMPLLTPWGWEVLVVVCLAVPVVGMWADWRRGGKVHPAWGWGVATILGSVLLTEAITYSPVGGAIYRAVVAGSPGVAVALLDFLPPPGPLPRAGKGDWLPEPQQELVGLPADRRVEHHLEPSTAGLASTWLSPSSFLVPAASASFLHLGDVDPVQRLGHRDRRLGRAMVQDRHRPRWASAPHIPAC